MAIPSYDELLQAHLDEHPDDVAEQPAHFGGAATKLITAALTFLVVINIWW